ncbi:hypothetical protein SAMN04487930_10799 [Cytophaga hutchinsonii ATCC 33406]|nr:hypothetical protein SAMN04487930_10799 [Cytophaga hutchinsonii ATCC 33406]
MLLIKLSIEHGFTQENIKNIHKIEINTNLFIHLLVLSINIVIY